MDEAMPPLDVGPHLALLEAALEEDRAREDATGGALVPADAVATADVVARQTLTLAGLSLAAAVFPLLDPRVRTEALAEDGDQVGSGTAVLTVSGPARAILAGERTALNALGHLSGIATLTRAYVEAVAGTGARVFDTRKTTPGWRALEKYAVRCGGGENHRHDLADAAMVKSNHLRAAFGREGPESIREAIRRCRAALPEGTDLYVEVRSFAELDAACEEHATVVMLDNFELGDVRRAVTRVRALPPPRPVLEATGGMRLDTVEAFAAAGVSRISVGAITKSAPAADLSLRVR